MSLFLMLPADKLESHSRLLRLWITSCCRALVRNGLQEENPVLFVLDEVGNIGQMKPLREGVTMLRGYGARFWFILQSLTQLKELFGENWNTVRAGIEHLVFFGIRDHETAEELSKLIGSTTVRSYSTSETSGSSRQSGSPDRSYSYSSGTTTTETGRRLIMPEEILQAHERRVFVVPKGVPPARAEQVRYYEDAALSALLAPPSSATAQLVPVRVAPKAVRVVQTAAERPDGDRIRFACRCRKRYSLDPKCAGKRAQCVLCRRVIVIPARSTLPARLPAPAPRDENK